MASYAINGFGRIGRNVLRALAQDPSELKKVKAINDPSDKKSLAHLLKFDSTQGRFSGEVELNGDTLIVNGHSIQLLAEFKPVQLPWKALGIDIVLESTGIFVSREGASKHLEAGAKKVFISAPAKQPDLTMCLGINHDKYDVQNHHIISNASCTTNCLAPLVKVLHDTWEIESGFMSTVHSYTNDQRILDLPHSDLRRARSAAINIIPSTTGAAAAIGEVIPDLKGKLDGGAFRVPTPAGSLTEVNAILKSPTSVKALNEAFKKASENELKGILFYTEEPLVSQDIVGMQYSSIIDSQCTMILGDRFVRICSWYDNEAGYSKRIAEGMKFLTEFL